MRGWGGREDGEEGREKGERKEGKEEEGKMVLFKGGKECRNEGGKEGRNGRDVEGEKEIRRKRRNKQQERLMENTE